MSETEKGKQDFNGIITGVGYKKSMDDPNKPPMTLIPPTLGAGIARVLGKGAAKYARGQWMNGMSFSEIASAVRRHLDAWELGEELDADTGLPHLYHIGAELAFLSWFQHGPRAAEYAKFDDRLFKPPAAAASKCHVVGCRLITPHTHLGEGNAPGCGGGYGAPGAAHALRTGSSPK